MTIRTRLALGVAAMAVVLALLGAASLHHLAALHRGFVDLTHHRAAGFRNGEVAAAVRQADQTLAHGRMTIGALLAIACGLAGALALRLAGPPRPIAEEQPSDVAPDPTAQEPARNPFVDRRGPDRAVNVVRPPFGQRSATGHATRADDWEAF